MKTDRGRSFLLSFLLGVTSLLSSCQSRESIRMNTFRSREGWGYVILQQGRPVIYQAFIPAVAGQQPFQTEMQAQRTAELVVHRMRRGTFPPSITRRDLDSLGVQFVENK